MLSPAEDGEKKAALMRQHLGKLSENVSPEAWIIGRSPVQGYGVFAARDLRPGETIFVDHALLRGPRARSGGDAAPAGCATCAKTPCTEIPLSDCAACALRLCGAAECLRGHRAECELIAAWSRRESAPSSTLPSPPDAEALARCLAPLRALLLDEDALRLLASLAAHAGGRHGAEVAYLRGRFALTPREERVMLHACRVLDANAYEMQPQSDDSSAPANLRGLFPMAALLNHSCAPNTRHTFDARGNMHVVASRRIPKGSEVFTTYAKLLWSTPARRSYLLKTKHFACRCARCCDRTEFGTKLAALKCIDRSCPGSLLPLDPLDFGSAWGCDRCDSEASLERVAALQSAVAATMRGAGALLDSGPESIDEFVRARLLELLPGTNYVVLELECRAAWLTGEPPFAWGEVSAAWLSRAETLCRGALRTCEDLGLGAQRLAGRLRLRLHGVLLERLRRIGRGNRDAEVSDLEAEIVARINESHEILKGDFSASPDLQLRFDLANDDVDKLLRYHETVR